MTVPPTGTQWRSWSLERGAGDGRGEGPLKRAVAGIKAVAAISTARVKVPIKVGLLLMCFLLEPEKAMRCPFRRTLLASTSNRQIRNGDAASQRSFQQVGFKPPPKSFGKVEVKLGIF